MVRLRKIASVIIMVLALGVLALLVFSVNTAEPVALGVDQAGNSYHGLYVLGPDRLLLEKCDPKGRRLWRRVFEGVAYLENTPGSWHGNRILPVAREEVLVCLEDMHNVKLLDYRAVDGGLNWFVRLPDLLGVVDIEKPEKNTILLYGLDAHNQLVCVHLNGRGQQLNTQILMPQKKDWSIWLDQSHNIILFRREGGDSYYLEKHDPQGRLLWQTKAQATRLLGTDHQDNIYLQDFVGKLVKYTAAGKKSWTLTLDKPLGNGFEMHYDAEQMLAYGDSLYFAGSCEKDNTREAIHTGAPKEDVFLCMANAQGKSEWLATMRAGRYSPFRGLGLDAAGNAFVAGRFTFADTYVNFMKAKYEPDGHAAWKKRTFHASSFTIMPAFFLMFALAMAVGGWKKWKTRFYTYLLMALVWVLFGLLLTLR